MKPKLLDLYCKAGGASAGYDLAGFEVTGVDHEPQPHYPFRFVLADALEYVRLHGHEFDAIAASPPCQHWSALGKGTHGYKRDSYPDLIAATRAALIATGRPYIIENVVGAPLISPITLCGQSLGLPLYRHRLFESNILLLAPAHRTHRTRTTSSRTGMRATARLSVFVTVAGHTFRKQDAADAMGINWMNVAELAQAIPPAFTFHLGSQLLSQLEQAA